VPDEATPDELPLIHARNLCKRFGSFTAVAGIDFEVARGEAFGFLGPNGAGKSSTIRMIGCVSPVTSGTLRILGMDPALDGPLIRARLGVAPQEDNLDLELTVRENLLIYGRYFDLPRRTIRERADRLLAFANLTERAKDKVDLLSGGMKRRLTITKVADQRTGHLAARRADHWAGPAGPPCLVGPALPPEAAGRHARPDHALHG
jgi:lipooligosaccharide transport system ATP-binding protein